MYEYAKVRAVSMLRYELYVKDCSGCLSWQFSTCYE